MSLELTCTSYFHGADPQKFKVPQPKPLILPLPTPPILGSIDILRYYFRVDKGQNYTCISRNMKESAWYGT